MKILSPTTLLIVLNTVVFLGGGFVSYVIISYKVDLSPPPPRPGKAVHSAPLSMVSVEDDSILSQPIFRRSRQALGFDSADSASSADKEAKVQPPHVPSSPTLVGVLKGEDGESWVLLEGDEGTSRQLLTKGGNFEGWRITRIGAKEATLHHWETKVDIQVHLSNASAASSVIPK